MFCSFPLEVIVEILSFLHLRHVLQFKNKELFNCILHKRNIYTSNKISNSIFYSFQSKCYKCFQELQLQHFINLCSKCRLDLDGEQHCQKICGHCMGDCYIPHKQNLKIKNCEFCNLSAIHIKTYTFQ